MPWSELNWEKRNLLGTYVKTVEQPLSTKMHMQKRYTALKRETKEMKYSERKLTHQNQFYKTDYTVRKLEVSKNSMKQDIKEEIRRQDDMKGS